MLLVDDEPLIIRGLARWLRNAGYETFTASDATEALRLLSDQEVDVVVSDVTMPGMSGLELLRAVRSRGLDVPVILVTGSPTLDSAVGALEHGVLRYLSKPLDPRELEKAVGRAAAQNRAAKAQRETLETSAGAPKSRSELESAFDRALSSLFMAYQPVVSWSEQRVFAFEALLRAREPSLPHPGAILGAAERMGRLADLGRAVRRSVAADEANAPPGCLLFVNLHTRDLCDDTLYDPAEPLSAIASRVVLEITERAALSEVPDVRNRLHRLRELGYRMALDDLGAGFAGLSSFAELEPDVVKLDMSLVRDIDGSVTKQKLVRSMIALCKEMGLAVVAEGVETPGERDVLTGLGCDLLQGYLFAKPAASFPAPAW